MPLGRRDQEQGLQGLLRARFKSWLPVSEDVTLGRVVNSLNL